MKNFKAIIPALLLLALISCQKDPTVVPDQPKSMQDLKISASFDWKTTQHVKVSIQGLQVPVEVKRTLVISNGSSTVFYKGMQAINTNAEYELVLPAYLKELTISFGTISKTLPIQNGRVLFNFIPNLPQNDN